MAIIRSDKLSVSRPVNQNKICSEKYVLLRIVHEVDSYTLMTATAAEDDGSYIAYHDLDKLVAAAERVIGRGERHADAWGRPYFRSTEIDHPKEIRDFGNRIAESLGLPPETEAWADEEGREIYEEFSASELDESAYISDGVYISSRGRLEG